MKVFLWVVTSVVFAYPITLQAQEDRLGKLTFNGFLSVVGGRTLDDNDRYLTNAGSDPDGSTYDDSVSFDPDTVFGIQARADLGEGFSATAQLLGRAADDFDMKFEWAYLQYNLTEEISLYAGRKRVPLYLYSDTLDLGYGYHWIRPPFEMYWIPITSYDGVSANYTSMLGPVASNLEVFFGNSESTDARSTISFGVDVELDLDNLGGAFWTLSYESFQARIGMAHARVEATADTPYYLAPPTFTALGGGPYAASEGNDIEYFAGALKFENDTFFILGEYGETQIEKDFNDVRAWYVSAGARMGKFTPHITFAEFHELATRGDAEERATTTVGVRYDFHEKASFKLEFSKVQDRGDTPTQSYFTDAELISIGIDVSF